METNKIYHGDSLELVKQLPDNYLDCVITSPPYFNLRSYLPDKVVFKKDVQSFQKQKIAEELMKLGINPIF